MSKEAKHGIASKAAEPPVRAESARGGLARERGLSQFGNPAGLGRAGASWPRQLLVLAALLGLAAMLLRVVGDGQIWIFHRAGVLIALTGIACWRWSWFALQNFRAVIYRYFMFPRLRREAARAVAQHGPVPEVTILATTYHEKPWITAPVFESI